MSNFLKEKSLIPGINKNIFSDFNKKSGLNKRLDSLFFKRKHIYIFNKIINKKCIEKKLKEKVKNNINFLSTIKTYKGNRHKLKYPTRGQRTHTNAKTRKKKYNKKLFFKGKPVLNHKSFKYTKIKTFNIKNIFRIKKVIKYKTYKPLLEKFLLIKTFKGFSRQLNIRVTSNNIFCNLKSVIKNDTLAVCSSGKYKVKTTRKKLKHNVKIVLTSFLNEIKLKLLSKNLIVVIVSPIRVRKQIIKFLSQNLSKFNLIVKVKDKKCFNGCRPPKKKRKKQKGLRIFK